MLTQRSQPLNELLALMNGAPGIGMPSFPGVTQYNQQAPDIAGLMQSNYNSQMQQHNQQQSGLSSGLFSLGSAAMKAGMFGSDRRIKKDIKQVGKLDNGLPVYLFRYLGDAAYQIGLMAQDVEQVNPDAVRETASGIKMVNYEMAIDG